jgi:hypothetical protein
MNSNADRDVLASFIPWMYLSLASLIVLQFALEAGWCTKLAWVNTILAFLRAVDPNFIAGITATILAHWWLRESSYAKYLSALKPVRESLRQAHANGLNSKAVQQIMIKVVHGTSKLYFESKEPPPSADDKNAVIPEGFCGTCEENCLIRDGRCDLCQDLVQSWLSQPPSLSRKLSNPEATDKSG